jgi:hypothetical protein
MALTNSLSSSTSSTVSREPLELADIAATRTLPAPDDRARNRQDLDHQGIP